MKQPERESNSKSQSHDTVGPVVRILGVEEFKKRYPLSMAHSDSDVARALQFCEEFWPIINGMYIHKDLK